MYTLCLPRLPGGTIRALAAGVTFAALSLVSPATCGGASHSASGTDVLSCTQADRAAAVPSNEEAVREAESGALLARALSLEVLGQYLWTNNLSESRARQRAYELRELAGVLRGNAERQIEGAATEEEHSAAERRLEVVSETSLILNDVADRISRTRGTRRKIRILALELSRRAWTVVRRNDLTVPEDEPVVPGRLFKEKQPPPDPRRRAYLREPKVDYLTYKRGAPDTDYLERRFLHRTPRFVRSPLEERIYYSEGALTLSPLDPDPRSRRIWWAPPAEELAWKVEQW